MENRLPRLHKMLAVRNRGPRPSARHFHLYWFDVDQKQIGAYSLIFSRRRRARPAKKPTQKIEKEKPKKVGHNFVASRGAYLCSISMTTHARPLEALPQETLWSIWDHCSFFDLVRLSRVSTPIETSVFAFVAERRLAADWGIHFGSGRGVVQLLTWWLRLARHVVNADGYNGGIGSDHVVVVECYDAIQCGAIHAWARRFGCASERAVYARFQPQHVYACECGLVSPLSSLTWTQSECDDSGYKRANCKRCRSFVTASPPDLGLLPADDGDPAWTLTHNAVIITADPGRMPLSVGPSVSDHHRPGGRAQWAEKNRAPADDAKTDDQIKAWVAYAFGRAAQWLPLETSICATRTERLFSTNYISGLRHTPCPYQEKD
ncbi:hypothetical protein TW95_gp0683 [Pandoravirus inopinatum]|uniref:F-box domain-containing protein n=1 Tax=Pandoravirus inopinatum TaxID=1605721 RepID=A0A0B5JCN7_9VIRU|nr:hypothetical protein TW95_gp0683 [Pandoravirus inopinatum]AJF97417.1 hypothetical protein [Pandoravirus inopinatum]